MSLSSWIAKLGVNPTWIAFNAHCWFAFALIVTVQLHWHYAWLAAMALAAFKEFYFDARYEVPKQTFSDNLTDYMGYLTGITLGVLKLYHLS